jgi:hypothetical protein
VPKKSRTKDDDEDDVGRGESILVLISFYS